MVRLATEAMDTHNSRWETLLSVDDYVGQIIGMLSAAGQLDNTYFLYTSECVARRPPHAGPSCALSSRRATRLPAQPRHLSFGALL